MKITFEDVTVEQAVRLAQYYVELNDKKRMDMSILKSDQSIVVRDQVAMSMEGQSQ